MKTIFTLMLLSIIASYPAAELPHLSDLDRQVMAMFNEHGHYSEPPGYPKGDPDWDRLQWYRDLGDKVRPGLMYLLTVDYKGDYHKMTNAINGLRTAPGDPSELLIYVRANLPGMSEGEDADGKQGYIQSCLGVLGESGTPDDMELIRIFQTHPDYLVRSRALAESRNLLKRIDSGEFDKGGVRRKPNPSVGDQRGGRPSASVPGPEANKGASEDSSNAPSIGWLIALAGLLIMALFGWWRFRSANRCPL
jgi:hypothetical protein